MDTVFVRSLSLKGKHGVEETERHTEQEFLIDIEADFVSGPSAASDALSDTIDYVHFVDIAREVVETNSFYLIEKLAHTIAERILEDERIPRVEVTIRKPSVLKSGVPGITIERKRA